MGDWQSEVPHILVVTDAADPSLDPPVDYELRHSSDCVTADDEHDCGVQFVIDGVGEPWCYTNSNDTHLPAGTYEVRFDCHTYPATPNGPEEYDAWLDVERVDLADLPVID